MAFNFNSAKNLIKSGIKVIIATLVLDVLWSLIRYILLKTAFNDTLPTNFLQIDRIITNSIVVISLILMVIGLFYLSRYYIEISRISYITTISLLFVIIIRIAIIICYFITIFNPLTMLETMIEALNLSAYILFIESFIAFNFYQMRLKEQSIIGLGHGLLPYLYGFFGLIYPISNLLNLLDVSYLTLPISLTFMHMFSYLAVILEILMFFDLLRRIDSLQEIPLQDKPENNQNIAK